MNFAIGNIIRNLSIAFATLLFVAVFFNIVPKAHAADLDFEGYDYIDTFTPDGTYYDSGYDYIDTYTPDYSYDSGFSDFSGGGFGGGGFSGGSGGWSMPTRSGGGMNQQQSLTNTNVNENYCTNGSCNTSSSVNAPTNVISYAPPAQIYSQPSYPVYPPVYTQPTYYPAPQPQRTIGYNTAPYVSLSAVPYTGLELGPVGTALYWGFLVLWCLIVAYLIVVKKIQNKIAAWFTGSSHTIQTSPTFQSESRPQSVGIVHQNSAPRLAGIDPFIQAQINRAK